MGGAGEDATGAPVPRTKVEPTRARVAVVGSGARGHDAGGDRRPAGTRDAPLPLRGDGSQDPGRAPPRAPPPRYQPAPEPPGHGGPRRPGGRQRPRHLRGALDAPARHGCRGWPVPAGLRGPAVRGQGDRTGDPPVHERRDRAGRRAGPAAYRGVVGSQPGPGDRARAAGLGGRRCAGRGTGGARPGTAWAAGVPALRQPRHPGGGAVRGAEEHRRHRGGGGGAARVRRQREGAS